jgi:adenosylcobinamide-phosphate synthase
VAPELTGVLAAHPLALAAAVALDLAMGDPVYRFHPVRLMGSAITWIEGALRRNGAEGHGGGIVLVALVAMFFCAGFSGVLAAAETMSPALAWVLHTALLFSLLALGDLVRHVLRVERHAFAGDLPGARAAIGALVGRDTTTMDAAACRRAAIESLSESLTDGFTSALFWYALAGIPGIVLFKVVSTLDSMVGYKTPRYLRFGWCGARSDDVMNYIPARLTWLLVSAAALVVPGCSPRKALVIGWSQHRILPGPNSGWSEAATAGAIARRLVGPIWIRGTLVTDLWIGDPADPPAGTRDDVFRSIRVVVVAGLLATASVIAGLVAVW